MKTSFVYLFYGFMPMVLCLEHRPFPETYCCSIKLARVSHSSSMGSVKYFPFFHMYKKERELRDNGLVVTHALGHMMDGYKL